MQRYILNDNSESQETRSLIEVGLETQLLLDPSSEPVLEQTFNSKNISDSSTSEDPVQIRNLTKRYGNHTVVDNISLSFRQGEVFAILGHNGAGKTTMLNILAGLIQPDEGDIIVQGQSIVDLPPHSRRQIGICLQEDVFERNHIRLCCLIKGFTDRESINDEVERLGALVGAKTRN